MMNRAQEAEAEEENGQSSKLPTSTTTTATQALIKTMDRQNPAASASQETLASLQMVDPLPLPDSRPGSISMPRPDPPAPPSKASTFSSLGLSGSGHSSVWYRM